ncbi:hypothetical protein CTA2_8323 [Colletotrichum tanaceti]|uniref:SUN domain-containing protein n=1 Tax=Colletotrichum tanaceti TaxID=1306861 RepID=A0A4U6XGK6_9PEZI|nr:hypothetical protein CTA2_8323 [Colletotrichum tanaceti]TKW54519.1 hypothetical protein CTA1_5441 [Colletotrichum tanaceti]
MPPRRRVRGDDDDAPLISRGGAAVSSDLPPLASRLDTSYGSAPSNTLRNTRRGQRRDLQAIIKETLHDSDDPDDPSDPDDDDDDDSEEDDDDDDESSERSKSTRSDRPPPVNSPSPKPVPVSKPVPVPKPVRKPQPAPSPDPDPDPNPDFGPGQDSSESPASSRGPSPGRPFGKNPPIQRLPATIEALAPPARTGQGLSPSKGGILTAASKRSVFARAISEEVGSPSHGHQLGLPLDPAPTPDSIRTFGQESSLFGGADIGTPSHPSRSSDEAGENSPLRPMPPRSNQPDRLRGPVRDPMSEVVHRSGLVDWTKDEDTNRPLQPQPPSTPPSQRYSLRSESPAHDSPFIARRAVARDPPRANSTSRQVQANAAPSPSVTTRSSSRLSNHMMEKASTQKPGSSRLLNHAIENESPHRPSSIRPSDHTGENEPTHRPGSTRLSNRITENEPMLRPGSSRSADHDTENESTPRSGPSRLVNYILNRGSSAPRATSTRHHVFEEEPASRPELRLPEKRTVTELMHDDPEPASGVSPRPSSKQADPGLAQRTVTQPVTVDKTAPTRRLINDPPPPNASTLRSGRFEVRSIRPPGSRRVPEEKGNRPPLGQNGSGLFGSDMEHSLRQEREQEKAQQEALRKERNARLQSWPRIYNTVYSWTHAPRPDSPPPRDEDSDGYDSPIEATQQVPLNESSWSTWILFKLADAFVDVLNFLSSLHSRHLNLKALLGILLLSLLLSLLGWGAMAGLKSAPARGMSGIQWYGFSDISHNLGQFVPLWMSRPTTVFCDEDTREYTRQQRNHEYELSKLTQASKLHEDSLSRLETIVPKIVHMQLDKHGRPVVDEEFWHALRDLMKGDTEILTMDRGHGGYYHISDEHWRAVKARSSKDTAEIENIAQTKFDKSWEKWLKTNNKKVAKILEPAFSTSIPDKIGKDLEYKIEKLVRDQFKNKSTNDVVVTRNEFIRHLQDEFVKHRNEVKAEAQELQRKLEYYINDAVKSASGQAPPAGVSRSEMVKVVDGMIRQAIANAGLEALAQGKIGATWDRELRHQVNFLGRHTGVLVDPIHTTPSWDPPVNGKFRSAAWYKSTKRNPEFVPPSATLWNWEDEGDCWCGKVTADKSGVEVGVRISYLLSHEIIPQHVVVEHILPGATLDPDARPREIDVLAYITELNTRNRVEDFAAAHFPRSKIVQPDGWVRIGHFTYESRDALNGVYVHKLSSELLSLGAVTDNVALQVVSNYGADHTCLYRARLYGEKQS